MKKRFFVAVCLGWAASTLQAGDKTPPTASAPEVINPNQETANAVAKRLGALNLTTGTPIGLSVKNGVVTLSGNVKTVEQAEKLYAEASKVDGVRKVESKLRLDEPETAKPAVAAKPTPTPTPMPSKIVQAQATSMPPLATESAMPIISANPVMQANNPGGMPQDPIPLMGNGIPAYDLSGPKLPPYAWPTYAPYNNFSRVAYPQAYPQNAFPYIGPFYPFPKVPLGWRSVSLQWEDGHWYLGRLSTPHDYWRVRHW